VAILYLIGLGKYIREFSSVTRGNESQSAVVRYAKEWHDRGHHIGLITECSHRTYFAGRGGVGARMGMPTFPRVLGVTRTC